MKAIKLFWILKGLTLGLTVFFLTAVLLNFFDYKDLFIVVIILLILNTISAVLTFLQRSKKKEVEFLCFLILDILIYIFLIYFLRIFLAFQEL